MDSGSGSGLSGECGSVVWAKVWFRTTKVVDKARATRTVTAIFLFNKA